MNNSVGLAVTVTEAKCTYVPYNKDDTLWVQSAVIAYFLETVQHKKPSVVF